MRSSNRASNLNLELFAGVLISLLAISCGTKTTFTTSPESSCPALGSAPGASCASTDPAPTGTFTVLSGTNVMAVTISSATSGTAQYGFPIANVPLVSVTICTPGPGTCQSIPDILLDTGSYGLRIFKSVISGPVLTPYTISSNPIGECTEFGSANTWGSVQLADVQLDGQTIHNFPIQQIDSTFEGGPPSGSACEEGGSVTSPAETGFNGILGVGLGTNDCPGCSSSSPTQEGYYSCTGNNCTLTTVAAPNQVQNPVPSLTTDNNGVLLELPQVTSNGSASVTGYLAFGIGTETNNKPSSWGISKVYYTDGYLNMRTTYNSQQYDSFIDSGSNLIFLPDCFPSDNGYLTPSCSVNLSATNKSYLTATSSTVAFQIGNADTLSLTGNFAFNNLGGVTFDEPGFGDVFDWGLSFFYGKTIFVGTYGKTAAGGELGGATGAYWAY
jgi:hypothetical protein